MFRKRNRSEASAQTFPGREHIDEPTPVGDLLEKYLNHDIRAHVAEHAAEQAAAIHDGEEHEMSQQIQQGNEFMRDKMRKKVNRSLGKSATFR